MNKLEHVWEGCGGVGSVGETCMVRSMLQTSHGLCSELVRFDSCMAGPCCARLNLLRRGWVPRMVRSKMYKFQQVGGSIWRGNRARLRVSV